jgi:hypothetical protein
MNAHLHRNMRAGREANSQIYLYSISHFVYVKKWPVGCLAHNQPKHFLLYCVYGVEYATTKSVFC